MGKREGVKGRTKQKVVPPKKPSGSMGSRGRSILSRIQKKAAARGVSQLSMDEIDAVIAKARRERRAREDGRAITPAHKARRKVADKNVRPTGN